MELNDGNRMNLALLLVYATLSLGFWTYSLYRLLLVERRRERWMGGADLLLLTAVALLSSAAWALLLPVYATGWMLSGPGQRLRRRVWSLGSSRATKHRAGRPQAQLRAL